MIQIKNLIPMVIFSRVVETLNFTETANSLQISKSSVTRSILQLEKSVGGSLLRRTTRRIEITELGIIYNQHCKKILKNLKESEDFIKSFNEELMGDLSVFAPVTLGSKYVEPALKSFMKKNINMDISLELSDEKINFEEGKYDLAITISQEPPSYMYYKFLCNTHFGLYANPGYLSKIKKINTPYDLPSSDYILYCGTARTVYLPFKKNNEKINIKVNSKFRCNNTSILINTILSGDGIAYLPNYIVNNDLSSGNLVRILPNWKMDVYKIWMLYKSEKIISSEINRFSEELQRLISATAIK